jgi:hypothetical protein
MIAGIRPHHATGPEQQHQQAGRHNRRQRHRQRRQGLDVELSVITDYSGFTALAYHAGTATGNDGNAYNLETDIRVMDGSYVAADGSRRRGLFCLV